MAKFIIKALAIAALVCLVIDLAASEDSQQNQQHQAIEQTFDSIPGVVNDPKDEVTTTAPSSIKDKLKGYLNTVKEGVVDAYESVSDSVSGAKHKVGEKSKEVVAGTKKLVNGAIEKIKGSYDSFKQNDPEDEVPRAANAAQEQAKVVVDKTNDMLKSERIQ